MSWLWGSSTNAEFEEAVEKACSPMKLPYPQGEDIALNLEITDLIRSKAVPPRQAMQSLKQRVTNKNGRVQMYALSLVDSCIKNGGDHFLQEIAGKEFVDEMAAIIRSSGTNPEVKTMALQYFQQWAIAFKSSRDLAYLVDVYNDLKNSGVKFPPPPVSGTSSHMIETVTAPAWVDSDACMRCRTPFSMMNRKHHCRNCGLIYDQQCSSHVMALPKFGIKEPVRVCDGCWNLAAKNKPAPAIPQRTLRSRQEFDADLERAIELSLQTAQPGGAPSEPPLAYKVGNADDEDEQLRLAIEASLRDMERARPSAPAGAEEMDVKPLPTFDLSARETETILTFSNTIDQMVAYGERDLSRFPQAHMLHDQVWQLGGKLQRNADEKSTKQRMLMEMQAKLNEAVQRYGQILDGEAAYAAKRAQEAQQRQYSTYGYQQPAQQQYTVPNANGYYVPNAPQPYAPAAPTAVAPAAPVPAQTTPAAPSMYPSMPAAQPPQAYQAQPYRWSPPSRQVSFSQQPQLQYGQAAPVSEPQSYARNPVAPEPQLPGRSNSQGVPSAPPPIDMASHPTGPQPVDMSAQPSAPPPVDMASHPTASPLSMTSPLAPARSASYSSSAPLATSPSASPHLGLSQPQQSPPSAQQGWMQASQPQSYAQQLQPAQPAQPQLQAAQPQPAAVSAPSTATQNPWSEQPRSAYTASMFPSAPDGFGTMLPSAPQAPLVEKHDEPLLIEL